MAAVRLGHETWMKIRVNNIVRHGSHGITKDVPYGAVVNLAEDGFFELAKHGTQEQHGIIWKSLDDEGYVVIALKPVYLIMGEEGLQVVSFEQAWKMYYEED